jgi:hypothetical protein
VSHGHDRLGSAGTFVATQPAASSPLQCRRSAVVALTSCCISPFCHFYFLFLVGVIIVVAAYLLLCPSLQLSLFSKNLSGFPFLLLYSLYLQLFLAPRPGMSFPNPNIHRYFKSLFLKDGQPTKISKIHHGAHLNRDIGFINHHLSIAKTVKWVNTHTSPRNETKWVIDSKNPIDLRERLITCKSLDRNEDMLPLAVNQLGG